MEKKCGKVAAIGLGRRDSNWWSHLCVKINWEEQQGSETDQVSMQGNKASELLTKIPVRAEAAAGETPSSQESSLERPTGS